MRGNKALFWLEGIGSYQYRLRIRKNIPGDKRQWFVFDRRTKTVRPMLKRNYVVANQIGQRFNRGKAAVIRPYRRESFVLLGYYSGPRKNFRNGGGLCLDVWGGINK